ncbi:MAG: hypothetical protein WBM32_05720 [Crocosphaera sp.]
MPLAPVKPIIDIELLDGTRNEIAQLIGSTNGELYFFERLNISHNYLDYIESKAEFLHQILEGNPIKGIGNIWSLSLEAIEEVEHEEDSQNDLFLIGYLIKYDQNYVEVAKARFFVEVESGLIAYHLVKDQINDKQFREYFCRVVEDKSIRLSIKIYAAIYPLDKHSDHFLRDIYNLESLSTVKIVLHPSNPSPSWAWKEIDDRLHELEATSEERLEANPGRSINHNALVNDPYFRSKVLMASIGYGLVIIIGVLPGSLYAGDEETTNELRISTGDRPIVTRVIENAENTLKKLANVFISLKKGE